MLIKAYQGLQMFRAFKTHTSPKFDQQISNKILLCPFYGPGHLLAPQGWTIACRNFWMRSQHDNETAGCHTWYYDNEWWQLWASSVDDSHLCCGVDDWHTLATQAICLVRSGKWSSSKSCWVRRIWLQFVRQATGLLRVAQFGHKTRQKLRDAELALRTPSMLLSCSFKVKAGKTELHIRSCPKDCMKSRCGDFPLTFLERRHISGANGAVLA